MASVDAHLGEVWRATRDALIAFRLRLSEHPPEKRSLIFIEYLDHRVDAYARAFWDVVAYRDGLNTFERIIRDAGENIGALLVEASVVIAPPSPEELRENFVSNSTAEFLHYATARIANRINWWIQQARNQRETATENGARWIETPGTADTTPHDRTATSEANGARPRRTHREHLKYMTDPLAVERHRLYEEYKTAWDRAGVAITEEMVAQKVAEASEGRLKWRKKHQITAWKANKKKKGIPVIGRREDAAIRAVLAERPPLQR
jgi:hypothetical protein